MHTLSTKPCPCGGQHRLFDNHAAMPTRLHWIICECGRTTNGYATGERVAREWNEFVAAPVAREAA